MPPSTSPRPLCAAEIPEHDQPQQDEKSSFGTELPIAVENLFTPIPLPSEEDMSLVPLNQAVVPSDNSRAHHSSSMFDPPATRWSAQDHFTEYGLPHENSAFRGPEYFSPASSSTNYLQNAQNGLSCNNGYSNIYAPNYMPVISRENSGTHFSNFPRDLSVSLPPASFHHYPSALQYVPSLPEASTPELMQIADDYEPYYGNLTHYESLSDYTSPQSGMSRASTPYSTGYEAENGPIDKEQPYAQLIYRALYNAPDYTMVLRDIYEWFKKNTDKASQSETKGWQNSIRHNLSMNGAFEKVDGPPDATTKGYRWRLTKAARHEGVKSTTRYRSKASNKRSQQRPQPLPQRQVSGAKGGHATRRAAHKRARDRGARTPTTTTPRSDPHSTAFYPGDLEDSVYGPSSPYSPTSPSLSMARLSQADSPYGLSAFTSYPGPVMKSEHHFSTMPGMASHLVSPLHSNVNTPIMACESLFDMSPTPSADEPITPTLTGDINVGFDGDVYGQFVPLGGGL